MSTPKFELDDGFKNLLPPLTDDERAQLMTEINQHGCRDPLVIWKEHNILIDGYNRFEICESLNLEYQATELSFTTRAAVESWIVRNQLGRRNLSDFNRIQLCLKLKPELQKQARERQAAAGGSKVEGDTKALPQTFAEVNEEIGKMAGASREQVRKVETIINKGSAEVNALVRDGKITVNSAYQKALMPETTEPTAVVRHDEVSQPSIEMTQERFTELSRLMFRDPKNRDAMHAPHRELYRDDSDKAGAIVDTVMANYRDLFGDEAFRCELMYQQRKFPIENKVTSDLSTCIDVIVDIENLKLKSTKCTPDTLKSIVARLNKLANELSEQAGSPCIDPPGDEPTTTSNPASAS